MSFRWSDLAGLARDLIDSRGDSETPEAVLRAAISRSYYAAFCTARDELEQKGVEVPPGGAHGTVGKRYGSSSDATDKEIGAKLGRLLKQRLIADYDLSPRRPIDVNLAELCHLLSVKTLQLLEGENEGEEAS